VTNAPHENQIHGDLVEVHGVGTLILGPSGIGKSETALELIARGQRLVADDLVCVRREGPALFGRAPDLIRHHMEIRGLGILSVEDLYGPNAIRDEARIELICRFEPWQGPDRYDRIGLQREEERILGLAVPRVTLPARTMASAATLVEVAARDHAHRCAGEVGAASLDQRVRRRLGRQ
jgi:HPr kinase/phosphorylase